MRFRPNWDSYLVSTLHQCDSPSAVITTYPPGYTVSETDSSSVEVSNDVRPILLCPTYFGDDDMLRQVIYIHMFVYYLYFLILKYIYVRCVSCVCSYFAYPDYPLFLFDFNSSSYVFFFFAFVIFSTFFPFPFLLRGVMLEWQKIKGEIHSTNQISAMGRRFQLWQS